MKGGRNKAKRIRETLQDDSGASSVEYALLASLIAVAIVTGVTTLGSTLNGIFGNAATGVGS
jgi:pilus assembly protein Flp/PilA